MGSIVNRHDDMDFQHHLHTNLVCILLLIGLFKSYILSLLHEECIFSSISLNSVLEIMVIPIFLYNIDYSFYILMKPIYLAWQVTMGLQMGN